MHCPYCQSKISESATVCPHCTRDLWLIKPLQAEIKALQKRITDLECPSESMTSGEVGSLSASTTSPAEPVDTAATDSTRAWPYLFMAMGLAVSMVMLVHWLFLFIYDVNPLALRISTIAAPALIAGWVLRPVRCSWKVLALTSLFTGGLAVQGMLMVTGFLDQVPIAPQNMRDWRETLEYGVAIALGFWTGPLVLALVRQIQRKNKTVPRAKSLLVLLQRDADGRINIEEISTELHRLITMAGPIVSGGMALYSGIKSLIS